MSDARRVLVVGESMLDRYWEGSVERISPEAPAPVLRREAAESLEALTQARPQWQFVMVGRC